jgi:hypothetical protein
MWEELSALATVASAIVVAIAAIAAVLQLRHLRLANQLQCYLEVMEGLQSPEISEARRFLQSLDFSDPETLRATTVPELDPRIVALGVHYQLVSRLLNRGVLDEELFLAYHDTVSRVWRQLQPVAAVMRARTNSALWIDVEYLAYRSEKKGLLQKFLSRYPTDFARQTTLAHIIAGPGVHGERIHGQSAE